MPARMLSRKCTPRHPQFTHSRSTILTLCSVVRRQSNGVTHAGRGGAGNVFKAGSAEAEAAAAATNGGSAVADDAHPASSASSATIRNSNDATTTKKPRSPTQRPEPEKSLATKGKEWLLGKK